ncbi:cobalamin biosynthesis protein CbiG [Bradyrhizobium sp. SSBR45G]|uniref:cobalamin biosynthesis protein n=1 Tax=unclassified Bradyrhizobium TaxID=2631580 RepID=UPI00234296C6|nr:MULTISPECIES: cobalamin biosynthesis protein [unclassified Bradyrhizobium]GLH79374.1 cobalamin biosynthesis protein CbiG [Bradyrhizobium sp. SSBR45G]GLH86690.1 cobalamin biosynthesis protein CbiG [Bradyrhizobium sp. SSBR45R]
MIALGIGCRREASAEDIGSVVAEALTAARIALDDVAVIATALDKLREPGVIETAQRLGRPLLGIGTDDLAAVADLAVTRSDLVQRLKGVPSIAETAALAAAGRHARLILPRLAHASATCALAQGEGAAENGR